MILKKYIRAAEPKMKNLQIINLQKIHGCSKKNYFLPLFAFVMTEFKRKKLLRNYWPKKLKDFKKRIKKVIVALSKLKRT
jgi:hypothetical protein